MPTFRTRRARRTRYDRPSRVSGRQNSYRAVRRQQAAIIKTPRQRARDLLRRRRSVSPFRGTVKRFFQGNKKPPLRKRKPRAALAIRRERMGPPLTQRRISKLLTTDCIPRPDEQTAASKRWQYHYEDMAISRGTGANNNLYKDFSNRPKTRFFRRFC